MNSGFGQDLRRHLALTLGHDVERQEVSRHSLYQAIALALRDRLASGYIQSRKRQDQKFDRKVYYLSLEFLMGRTLTNAVHALALEEQYKSVLLEFGHEREILETAERDAGLGNGGLGRLAACFLDSCATLDLPVSGYGIRYQYGMFRQQIENAQQVEYPDAWLQDGNPWEIERRDEIKRVKFGGHTEMYRHEDESLAVMWQHAEEVLAVPYDTMVPGAGGVTVNRLRLWRAEAAEELNLSEFNRGSYPEAVEDKNRAENISMVLYPDDSTIKGKALRLRQQYFLASATVQDVVEQWVKEHGEDFDDFGASNVFQLNDTHPVCAIPELMRVLIDDYRLGWRRAWDITVSTMAYTNHTLLPEALEKWPVWLFGRVMPRILEIIYEINARFLQQVSVRWPGDEEMVRKLSLIEEGDEPQIRMAYLAVVGSFSINGVAELHTRLLIREIFTDFYTMWPERFNNKTNGVTPRRWIHHANPGLRALIDSAIGDSWHKDLLRLESLGEFADDPEFQSRWRSVKLDNKMQLAQMVQARTGVAVVPEWLLDVQVKRIHEYKRQLLNALHVVHLYDRIHRGDGDDLVPRTVLFGGKAAPGYAQAKKIIHFVNCIADVINNDPIVNSRLRVAFVPNYDVSTMEMICPAADLSEQISTAGKEASGTGNMKFMMNGALTIGTLDGANIEIRACVGHENFFEFGLTSDEVMECQPSHDPHDAIAEDEDLQRALSLIDAGIFSLNSHSGFEGLGAHIRRPGDPWMVAADFKSYKQAQARVEACRKDEVAWTRKSILNTAASGYFSSDRTIDEYARHIWGLIS